MKAGELLKLCWYIANLEAKHLGATEILPIHFLLAVMKIIDPTFPEMLDKLKVDSGEWASMCQEAQSIRQYIEVLPDRITVKRRALRSRLAARQTQPPIAVEGMLHRSQSLKRAFSDACLFAEGDVLQLRALVVSLFEQELVSLDDIKG